MNFLLQYAMQFIGQPYYFGGNDPQQGWDCSGLVGEILLAGGAVPFGTRTNAQGLYDLISTNGGTCWNLGSVAFFGQDMKSIVHVGWCLDSFLMLEAGGGDSGVVDTASAIARHAFVKMRPIRYRKDFLTVLKPSYARIGYP